MKDLNVLMEELWQVSHEIEPWYGVDKVKGEAVYIWTHGEDGENVFDICSDGLQFYVKDHEVIEAAKPTIEKIQAKLQEIDAWWKHEEQQENAD